MFQIAKGLMMMFLIIQGGKEESSKVKTVQLGLINLV